MDPCRKEREIRPSTGGHRALHSLFPRELWKCRRSSKRVGEALYEAVELGVGAPESVDLADGMDDGRVVLAPEGLADVGKTRPGERLREVHRDLTRERDGLRVVARLQVRDLEPEVIRHVLLDRVEV